MAISSTSVIVRRRRTVSGSEPVSLSAPVSVSVSLPVFGTPTRHRPRTTRRPSGSWGMPVGECCDPIGEIPAFAGMTGWGREWETAGDGALCRGLPLQDYTCDTSTSVIVRRLRIRTGIRVGVGVGVGVGVRVRARVRIRTRVRYSDPASTSHHASPQRKLGYPCWRVLRPEWGDPSFRWDDGWGAGTIIGGCRYLPAGRGSTKWRRVLPCSPAKAGAQTGSPPSRGHMVVRSHRPWPKLGQKTEHPGEGRGPIGGGLWRRGVLRCLGYPSWAPAFAGVVALGVGAVAT